MQSEHPYCAAHRQAEGGRLDMPTFTQKVCIGFAVGCAGDAGGQYAARGSEGGLEAWDSRRTALWGLGVAGLQVPLFHAWFRFIEGRVSGHGFAAGVKKAAIESITAGPAYLALVNVWASLVIKRGYCEADPVGRAADSLQEQFPTSYQKALCIMFPAQVVSHSFVPVQYKTAYLNVVSSVWNVVLSQMLCRQRQREDTSRAGGSTARGCG